MPFWWASLTKCFFKYHFWTLIKLTLCDFAFFIILLVKRGSNNHPSPLGSRYPTWISVFIFYILWSSLCLKEMMRVDPINFISSRIFINLSAIPLTLISHNNLILSLVTSINSRIVGISWLALVFSVLTLSSVILLTNPKYFVVRSVRGSWITINSLSLVLRTSNSI